MGEQGKTNQGPAPQNMDALLRERDQLNRNLENQFAQNVVILFSDICGYTQYTERWSDLEARAYIQRHNDIVFPILENTGGGCSQNHG